MNKYRDRQTTEHKDRKAPYNTCNVLYHSTLVTTLLGAKYPTRARVDEKMSQTRLASPMLCFQVTWYFSIKASFVIATNYYFICSGLSLLPTGIFIANEKGSQLICTLVPATEYKSNTYLLSNRIMLCCQIHRIR